MKRARSRQHIMRDSLPSILLLAALFSFFSCEEVRGVPEQTKGKLIEGKKYVLREPAKADANGNADGETTQSGASGEDAFLDEPPATKIPLDNRDTLLSVENVNLDADQIEEQIIVLKGKEKPDAPIKILVVDYDSVRNGYFLTWQGTTGATDSRTFSFYLEDLTGDHTMEIVCTGLDTENQQTLDIFRRTHAPSGFGLYYLSIFSTSTDGTVDIQKTERASAYELEQKSGQSFPIVIFSKDTESGNLLDLIRRTYYWKYQENSYVLAEEEKIPGAEIQEKRLHDIYLAGEDAFEDYLNGPWYNVSAASANSGRPSAIIFFEPDKRDITFYAGDIQEIYSWVKSTKKIFRILYINSANESIPVIKRQLLVTIQSLDTITVDTVNSEEWDGTYKRLPADVQKSMVNHYLSPVKLSPFELSGLYRAEGNFEMYFSYPYITISDNGKKLKGGYAIYSAGANILEIKILKDNGLPLETKTYAAEYSEERDDYRIVRSVKLIPATVNVNGLELSAKDSVKLEQIEVIEKE